MTPLTIEVVCPRCGGELETITQRKLGYGLRLIVRCTGIRSCRYEFIVKLDVIHARTAEDGEPTKCGSEAGYKRHRRVPEQACDLCHEAHMDAQTIRRAKRKQEAA